MAEIKAIKNDLIQKARDGELTPSEAYAQFDKIPAGQVRTGRIYEQKDANGRISQYRESRAVRRTIRANRVPFISKSFLPGLWLSQGLALIGAKSGRAKSTTASNVLSGFLRSVPEKNAIIISNEEATDAIYERTACILLELNYQEMCKGNFTLKEEKMVEECIETFIIPRVEVVEDGKFNMSFIEDVQSVLETAATDKVGIVLVDYLQCITQSRNEPSLVGFEISKKLGFYFKDYGKQHGVPVVCFAQLSDGGSGADFASRVQNDKTIYNHAFLAIEIEPDFETCTAKFKVHKDRFFGHTGKEVIMDFKGGRYEVQGGEAL